MKMHFGIDYGAKLAGTTVICFNDEDKLHLVSSQKKEDSDQFISNAIKELRPTAVYIDAPLSIPSAYFGKGENYHYRKCDVETSAMSPMFLGGLTARAMKLRSKHPGLDFHETYPSYSIREIIDAKSLYKKKQKVPGEELIALIQSKIDLPIVSPISNYHQLDAIICWLSGMRHMQNEHIVLGDENEGVIIL